MQCDGDSDAATIIPDPHGGEEEIRLLLLLVLLFLLIFISFKRKQWIKLLV